MNRSNVHHFLKSSTSLKHLQQIHAQSIAHGFHLLPQSLSCKILNLYSKLDQSIDALNVFSQIPHPDLITLTSLLNLHLQTHQPLKSISLFSNLISSGLKPDGFAVVAALSACGQIPNLRIGKSVHGLVCRHELGWEVVVNNALIDMYCRNGRIQLARMVFQRMGVRDSVTWSSMLNGHVICGGLEVASKLFDEMPQRDVVCWTVMITAHVQKKHPVKAVELFHGMRSEGHRPTLITIVSVLSACADIGASDLGRAIHGCIAKMDLGLDATTVYNALIDMYSKSGDLRMADEIFKGIVQKDVFTWTTVISGFAVHGEGKRAMEVFRNMLVSRVRPNKVTFLAVLLACSHSGLVDEGRNWFEEMREVYKLEPQIEHYGCMVDLLGRAGLLKEAAELIKEMDMRPDCVIWRSLLAACLVHGNAELAEIAGKEILKEEPEDDGVYVLLWNMYASSNRWEEALETRRKMRERKVIKRPGCSWIEVDGLVHEFLVEDRMHGLRRDIYEILEGLVLQLKVITTDLLEDDYFFDQEQIH